MDKIEFDPGFNSFVKLSLILIETNEMRQSKQISMVTIMIVLKNVTTFFNSPLLIFATKFLI